MRGRSASRSVPARQLARLAHFAALLAVAGAALAAGDTGTATRAPRLAVPDGKCVEDTAYMRRNHMELLKHQRDRTVREGIRTTQHSLANCVTCHAGKETRRVTGSKDAFCEGCHSYAGVRLDCFECHSDRPKPAVAAAMSAAVAAPERVLP
jgi:hypothetical protein